MRFQSEKPQMLGAWTLCFRTPSSPSRRLVPHVELDSGALKNRILKSCTPKHWDSLYAGLIFCIPLISCFLPRVGIGMPETPSLSALRVHAIFLGKMGTKGSKATEVRRVLACLAMRRLPPLDSVSISASLFCTVSGLPTKS